MDPNNRHHSNSRRSSSLIRQRERADTLNLKMLISLFSLLLASYPLDHATAFIQIRPVVGGTAAKFVSRKYSSSSTTGGDGSPANADSDAALQWELFNKHHAGRSWRGTWSTLDYMGDVIDETLASIKLKKDGDAVRQEHEMVVGGKVADCETCFDSFETQTLPVATYSEGQLYKQRLAAVSLVNGPRVLRSGSMTTELVLRHGDGRVRVIFYHAPAWKNKEDEYQIPPDGLKFYRVTISREADRDEVPNRLQEQFPNTPEKGNPKFFRPVPPFAWHKKWGGTSWTWGPQSGDKGWMIEDMEEGDAWHGEFTPVFFTDSNALTIKVSWVT